MRSNCCLDFIQALALLKPLKCNIIIATTPQSINTTNAILTTKFAPSWQVNYGVCVYIYIPRSSFVVPFFWYVEEVSLSCHRIE